MVFCPLTSRDHMIKWICELVVERPSPKSPRTKFGGCRLRGSRDETFQLSYYLKGKYCLKD